MQVKGANSTTRFLAGVSWNTSFTLNIMCIEKGKRFRATTVRCDLYSTVPIGKFYYDVMSNKFGPVNLLFILCNPGLHTWRKERKQRQKKKLWRKDHTCKPDHQQTFTFIENNTAGHYVATIQLGSSNISTGCTLRGTVILVVQNAEAHLHQLYRMH